MTRVLFTVVLCFVISSVSSANDCRGPLSLVRVPWVDPVVFNLPVKSLDREIGLLGIHKSNKTVLRPCTWCPRFASQAEAEAWLANHTLGKKTMRAIESLRKASQKNMADHFYGVTLKGQQIHFVSRVPQGPLLMDVLKAQEPLIPSSRGGTVSPQAHILPDHVRGFIKIRQLLNSSIDLPFEESHAFFEYESPQASDIVTQFLGSIEWSLNSNGEVRLSFFDLGKIYDSEGIPYRAFQMPADDENPAELGYSQLLMSLLTILNQDPNAAWNQMLKGKVLQYFLLPLFHQQIRDVVFTRDLVMSKLVRRAKSVTFQPVYKLIEIYDSNRFHSKLRVRFQSDSLWTEHFEKHGHEFGAKTREEYLRMAQRFISGQNVAAEIGLQSANTRIEYRRINVRPDEYVIMDAQAEIVVVVNSQGMIRTFFIHKEKESGMDAEEYFMEQARKQLVGPGR